MLEQKISGNQDLPEGGFDGFLQSLLCTNVSLDPNNVVLYELFSEQ